MEHFASTNFWIAYKELPPKIRAVADKNFALLKQDSHHPSLHFKKVGRRYWSVRVGGGYRALAKEVDGGLLWGWIGSHDEYNRRIKAF